MKTLLVVLCAFNTHCEHEWEAVYAADNLRECRAQGKAQFPEYERLWLCVKDIQVKDEWSEFE